MRWTSVAGGALAAAIAVAVLDACAMPSRYEVLTVFFEGVPDPNAPVVAEVESEQVIKTNPLSALRRREGLDRRLHAPYQERACGECHNMYQGGKVREVPGGLCLSCHGELLQTADYVHGPVAVHACSACHDPHESKLEGLLLDRPAVLCTGCHAREDLLGAEYHGPLDQELDCVRCHDPHGGSDNLFLRHARGG